MPFAATLVALPVAPPAAELAALAHRHLEPFLESNAKSTSHPRGVDGTNPVPLALGNRPLSTTTNHHHRKLRAESKRCRDTSQAAVDMKQARAARPKRKNTSPPDRTGTTVTYRQPQRPTRLATRWLENLDTA